MGDKTFGMKVGDNFNYNPEKQERFATVYFVAFVRVLLPKLLPLRETGRSKTLSCSAITKEFSNFLYSFRHSKRNFKRLPSIFQLSKQ